MPRITTSTSIGDSTTATFLSIFDKLSPNSTLVVEQIKGNSEQKRPFYYIDGNPNEISSWKSRNKEQREIDNKRNDTKKTSRETIGEEGIDK